MHTSLRSILLAHSEVHADSTAFTWLDTSSEPTSLSYARLSTLSFSLARFLKNHGVEPGDRVVLLGDGVGVEAVVGFFACQVLRAVPVPLVFDPKDPTQLISTVVELRPDTVLVPPRLKDDVLSTTIDVPDHELHRHPESLEQLLKRAARLGVFVVDALDERVGGTAFEDEHWEGEEGDGLAWIQFTAGRDSESKGILVSHQASLAYLQTISATLASDDSVPETAKRVSLLNPPRFDRLFIMGALRAVYEGGTAFLIDPDTIQNDPLAYFRILSENQITSALVPHTLLADTLEAWKRLPAERRPKLETWDLSKCTEFVVYGGTVPPDVLEGVRELFRPAKMQAAAFCATYGLSPYPLVATADLSASSVSYTPCKGVTVKIVDPVTREDLPDGFQGEIWVDGAGVPSGFLALEDEEEMMGELQGQAYLRTGDLGVLENGKFTVSGRLSESFSINGKTYFAPDIESIVLGYHGVEEALLLPFPAEPGSGRPTLVLLLEMGVQNLNHMSMFDHKDLCVGLYRRVSALKGVKLTNILIFPHELLPRIVTGEFAKAAARSAYLRSDMPQKVYQWDLNLESMPPTPREEFVLSPIVVTRERSDSRGVRDLIRRQWKMVLQIPIDDADDFYALGGSLTQAMRITYAVRKALKCPQVGIHHLYGSRTFGEYASTVIRVSRSGDDDDESHQARQKAEAEKSQWLWDQVTFPEDFKGFEPHSRVGPSTPSSEKAPENILLLGATTALGSFVLAELLNADRSTPIYCVVDAETEEGARAAVVSTLKKHILWRPQWPGRIIPVVGNPSAKQFGMTQTAFKNLANDVRLVVCALGAGEVDLLGPYALHEKETVLGAREAIRLALSNSSGIAVPAHFVSSLDVFDDAHYAQELEAHHPPLHSRTPGKAQAHWVAEQLILKASRDYRLPAAVYRVGCLLGNSSTGASFAVDGPLNVILNDLHKTKKAPAELLAVSFALTTVDHAAKAIVTSALAPPPRARSQLSFYHILNVEAYPFSRAMEVFENVTGESTGSKSPIPLAEWLPMLEGSLPPDLLPERSSTLRNVEQEEVSVHFAAITSAFFNDAEGLRALGGSEEVSTVQMQDRLRRLGFSIDRTLEEIELVDRALAVGIKWARQETKRRKLREEAEAAAALKQEQLRTAVQNYSQEKQVKVESGGSTVVGGETAVAVAQRRALIGDMQRLREWILRTPSLAFLTVLLWTFLGQ